MNEWYPPNDSFTYYDDGPMQVDWDAVMKLAYKGKKMDYVNTVEDLIQQTKDQNGRVYNFLRDQEKRIKILESENSALKSWRDNHKCPSVPYNYSVTSTNDLFDLLIMRSGPKGILKMLAER